MTIGLRDYFSLLCLANQERGMFCLFRGLSVLFIYFSDRKGREVDFF